MIIHRAERGECCGDIARKYGVCEDILRMNNNIFGTEPAEGEELLVLTPTRSYVAERGDTIERLALRFGVLRRELLANNPIIEREGLRPGQRLALKYGDKIYGQAATNGYYFGGSCRILRERLPHFTYVTVGAAVFECGRIRETFDGREAVGILRMADKIPLLRIFCKDADIASVDDGELIAEQMLSAAINGGYKGIVLGGEPVSDSLLLKLRRHSFGCDLILFSEVGPKSGEHLCDSTDGTVFSGLSPVFRPADYISELKDFAAKRENNRCMPELCPFAENNGRYIPIEEALSVARRGGCKIEHDESAGACRFTHSHTGEYVFPSLENIKATLDTVHEYGYMGISFDVARTPQSHLMMYGALFGKRG